MKEEIVMEELCNDRLIVRAKTEVCFGCTMKGNDTIISISSSAPYPGAIFYMVEIMAFLELIIFLHWNGKVLLVILYGGQNPVPHVCGLGGSLGCRIIVQRRQD